jgi:anti-sigma regulatory factor (Ser/Thr protein kinase)
MFVQRHDLRAVCDVRRFVRSALSHWNEDALADDAELMATELVTNALIHADSEVDVRLREAEDRIRVEVRDSDPRPPLPAPITFTSGADGDSEHGRGLLIVEALASAWGNAPRGRGKSVWFEMSR